MTETLLPDRESTTRTTGSWHELFTAYPRQAGVLAGGIAVYSTSVYVTTTLLPDAVADIGGRQFYSWAMTAFLLASVVSSMLVAHAARAWGFRASYIAGFGSFAIGSLVAALAPTIAVLLAGRVAQGLGGGLLAGLGYVVIRGTLPERLWPRAIAWISAMWGVGNLVGPLLGGVFAQIGWWRGAFVLLLAASLLGAWASRVLPQTRDVGARASIPVVQLGVLVVATALVSVAGVAGSGITSIALFGIAVTLLVAFVVVERRSATGVLPRRVFDRASRLRWVYVAVAVLGICSTVEMFVPLFGRTTAGMSPLTAGLLGAAISWGWVCAQIASSNAEGARITTALRALGPAVLALALVAYGALQVDLPSTLVVAAWFVVLAIAGAGIGTAFPHVAAAALTSASDAADGAKASAGINFVQLVATAFGSALAGLLVTVGGASLLALGFAGVAVVGVVAAVRR